MSLKIVDTYFSKLPKRRGALDGSTTVVAGQLLYRDTTNKVLKVATSSAGTTLNIVGIATEGTTSATEIEYLPVGSSIFVVGDCTANTAANQLNIAHAMTDGATINNTSSHVATTLGVFIATELVGASTDKKLYGYFVKLDQVTA